MRFSSHPLEENLSGSFTAMLTEVLCPKTRFVVSGSRPGDSELTLFRGLLFEFSCGGTLIVDREAASIQAIRKRPQIINNPHSDAPTSRAHHLRVPVRTPTFFLMCDYVELMIGLFGERVRHPEQSKGADNEWQEAVASILLGSKVPPHVCEHVIRRFKMRVHAHSLDGQDTLAYILTLLIAEANGGWDGMTVMCKKMDNRS